MTYKEADALLQGRCKKSRSVDHYTYLVRHGSTIRLLVGYQRRYSLMTFCEDGRIIVTIKYHYPSYRNRINNHLPNGYQIVTYRSHWFINDREIPGRFIINRDGSLPRFRTSTLEQIKKQLALGEKSRKRDWERMNRPRRRGFYWTRKARGIYFHRQECTADKPKWRYCDARQWTPQPGVNRTFKCGCKVEYKKPKSTDTVASILHEENATVRAAKIRIYGIARFFQDAGGYTMDITDEYRLMRLNLRDQVVIALQMKCPSTGQVYVNTVPPHINTVLGALNWIYDTNDFTRTVGKQT